MIYGFKNPSQYDGDLFKPVRKIYNQLIEDEAENMEKILLSLVLKTTTQSINAFILSKLMEMKENEGLHDEADAIKRISPIGWRDVDLYGKYEFRKNNLPLSVDELIKSLERSYRIGPQNRVRL